MDEPGCSLACDLNDGWSYLLPGELLSSHAFHHGRECRPTAWYNTVMARRRRGEGPNTEDEVVDEITEAMEGDERLMSDNVDGEIMRRYVESSVGGS